MKIIRGLPLLPPLDPLSPLRRGRRRRLFDEEGLFGEGGLVIQQDFLPLRHRFADVLGRHEVFLDEQGDGVGGEVLTRGWGVAIQVSVLELAPKLPHPLPLGVLWPGLENSLNRIHCLEPGFHDLDIHGHPPDGRHGLRRGQQTVEWEGDDVDGLGRSPGAERHGGGVGLEPLEALDLPLRPEEEAGQGVVRVGPLAAAAVVRPNPHGGPRRELGLARALMGPHHLLQHLPLLQQAPPPQQLDDPRRAPRVQGEPLLVQHAGRRPHRRLLNLLHRLLELAPLEHRRHPAAQ
mmetsp:Transcript_14569/g.41587  ORF Transcript_14569/g.41587 Transcript_14569/m.41587 type:complete len:291 (-) Transcript_14569:218-1090(-)